METLQESKEFLRANFDKGVSCPCCNQFVKLYKRKLNSGMAMALIHIYKQGNWINVKDYMRKNSLPNNHDWTLLRYWGLIEESTKTEEGKKTNGVWRITQKGVKFIEKKINVQIIDNVWKLKLDK
jgi:predicted transcriptional regulator